MIRRGTKASAGSRLAGVVGGSLLASVLLPGVTGAASSAAPKGAAFSKSVTIARTHLVSGADTVVEQRTFKVSVDLTTQLRDRQEINVMWSGGHPTGGLVGDQNSGLAAEQEYPVVLMQCRGVDSSSAPASKRLSPETCWTHTPAERSQSDTTFNFPPYRLDRYAMPAERKATVGVPYPLPSACTSSGGSGVQHWIPFRAAAGTIYPGGPFGCAGMPPEAVNVEGSLQPSNTTYGASDKSGSGSAKFAISTAEANASLGCSNNVACSLVIVPIIGLSCDPAGTGLPAEDQPSPQDVADAAYAKCSATGKYQPGEYSPGTVNQEDLAVSGELWWSASNWRNHITVPLTFAAPANICNLVNSSAPLYLYGSELIAQATQQWSPRFCLDPKLFKLQHVLTGEPQAKNLLEAGSVEAALQGSAPQTPFARPVVQAPAALTGFAIAYTIDDRTKHEYHDLKLTPRLLAKLLSESYPALPSIQSEYSALTHNPLDLVEDPEFRALNPSVGTPSGYNTQPAGTLFVVSSDSDVIWALTSYIQADPEARAWLDGDPDPWGMVVNPHYKGIKLPVIGWPLLDTYQSGTPYQSDRNPCLNTNPVPFLPLVAAPVSALATLTLNMQFGIANSQIVCANAGNPNQKLVAMGRENPGQRFIVGLTSLADAARYQLDTAALQTHITSSAPKRFTDSTGRTFVGPSRASLRAVAALLKADAAVGTWPIPYASMRSDSKGTGAYPGTMLISIDMPTAGLPKADAQRYAQVLRFVATQGQTPGFGNGQLPPGYLPMTAANGLSVLARYTQAAALAVAVQSGSVPSVTNFATAASTPGGGGRNPTTTHISLPPPFISPLSQNPSSAPAIVAQAPVASRTLALGSGLAGLAFPLALLIALVGATASAVIWLLRRKRVAR